MSNKEFGPTPPASLRAKIRQYMELAKSIKFELTKNSYEWGKYQSIFNYEVNGVFREIMDFEKTNLLKGEEEKVYKLKKLFVNRIRSNFLYGKHIRWSLEKPYGYAGDFQIIEDIYENKPDTTGFDRLFDNYFQMSSISVAVRNRKDDFKKIITRLFSEQQSGIVRIMSLACGPSREIIEFVNEMGDSINCDVIFDCVDNDANALEFSKRKLRQRKRISFNFIKENAVRLALKKDIESVFPFKYNLIYSTGLFDYFEDRIIERLVGNLKKIITEGGLLAISDVRDKYSNPSVHFMEWVGDWSLIYREDENFRKLFIKAGFLKKNLEIDYEQQGILQYITARA